MKWDAIAFTIRSDDENRKWIEEELDFHRRCGLITCDYLLVVEDPTGDIGSGGSTLNALFVVAERLCTARGFTVLNESVLNDSNVLIVHSAQPNVHFPHGIPFTDLGELQMTKDAVILRTPFSILIDNVNRIAVHGSNSVWILGTDALWTMKSPESIDCLDGDINVFTFNAEPDIARSHGVYELDGDNVVSGMSYRKREISDPSPLVLALLRLSPSVSISLLSLHSVYPLSFTTYYGADNYATDFKGFKLSLFFDFIFSTCSSFEEFLTEEVIPGKCDSDEKLRILARTQMYRKISKYSSRAVFLPIDQYQYFQPNETSLLWKGLMASGGDSDGMERLLSVCFDSLVEILSKRDNNSPFTPFLKTISEQRHWDLERVLRKFDEISQHLPSHSLSRCCYAVSCILSLYAKGEGGLRCGPAKNKDFPPITVEQAEKDLLHNYFLTTTNRWIDSATRMMRAARHFEAAAQSFTRKRVEKVCERFIPYMNRSNSFTFPHSVHCTAAARVDLYGGWLDTPPITLDLSENGVVNMAILVDGEKPLGCTVTAEESENGLQILTEHGIVRIESEHELFSKAHDPTTPGALVCACFVVAINLAQPESNPSSVDSIATHLSRYFGCNGLKVECHSSLPHGSGLGTSSILAGALLASFWTFMGIQFTEENIAHLVLQVEQQLTTGGGWQDAVGGIYPGLKTTTFSEGGARRRLNVSQIQISKEFENQINNRLALIYTGKTRLAKNLLQEVLRGWFSREGAAVKALFKMQNNLQRVHSELKGELFPTAYTEEYFEAKKELATGCEPNFVKHLIEILKIEQLIESAWMAGAGGGGFLYIWMSENGNIQNIRETIHREKLVDFTVHSCTIDMNPLLISSTQ